MPLCTYFISHDVEKSLVIQGVVLQHIGKHGLYQRFKKDISVFYWYKHSIARYITPKVLNNLKLLHILNSKVAMRKAQKYIFSKYYYVGLGYKMYVAFNKLFIWVGLTHYTLLHIPKTLLIYTKKRRIYMFGRNKLIFKDFLSTIRRVRKKDIYKGKGLLEVKTYKNFLRMKTGKKKQY